MVNISCTGYPHYTNDSENEFLDAISRADREAAHALLAILFDHYAKVCGCNLAHLQSRMCELLVLISRTAIANGADPHICQELSHAFLHNAIKCNSADLLKYHITGILDKYIDELCMPKIKHYNIVNQATEYINHHYAEKITLCMLSNMVYLSAPYFSKIFKEELGTSFNSYLNRVRIEQSKLLLKNNALKLIDISLMVGFESQSYFTKVFKKLVGIPPLRYRAQYYK